MALWWLQGLDEDHKGGFCDHSVRKCVVMATWVD